MMFLGHWGRWNHKTHLFVNASGTTRGDEGDRNGDDGHEGSGDSYPEGNDRHGDNYGGNDGHEDHGDSCYDGDVMTMMIDAQLRPSDPQLPRL